MSIEFEEEQNNFNEKFSKRKENKMANWLQKKGIATNEDIAKYILIGVVVVVLILTFFLFRYYFGDNNEGNDLNRADSFMPAE